MLAGVAGVMCFGCGGGAESTPAPADTSSRSVESPLSGPIPIQVPALPPVSGGPVATEMQTVVDAALADASRRTGMPMPELAVASAESVRMDIVGATLSVQDARLVATALPPTEADEMFGWRGQAIQRVARPDAGSVWALVAPIAFFLPEPSA